LFFNFIASEIKCSECLIEIRNSWIGEREMKRLFSSLCSVLAHHSDVVHLEL
jgi:hypothetical protein